MRVTIVAGVLLLVSVPFSHALFWKASSSSASNRPTGETYNDGAGYFHGEGEGGSDGGEDNNWNRGAHNPFSYTQLVQPPPDQTEQQHAYLLPPTNFNTAPSFGDPGLPLLDPSASTEGDPYGWYSQQGSSFDYAPHQPSFSDYQPHDSGMFEPLPQYELPPDYSASAFGMSANMGTLTLMPEGEATSMAALGRIRTAEGDEAGGSGTSSGGAHGGGSATARVRGHTMAHGERQLPQTARVRRPRRETDEAEATPSTARASGNAAAADRALRRRRTNERQQLAETRSWLLQQWKARGMKFSMHPQILPQQIAEIKIMNPERVRQICLVSTNIIDEAKAADEDYLYDYHTWADVYQDRLHAIRTKYTQRGIDKDSDEMKALLMAEYKTTKAKHCASLADPASEAWDIEYSREVWATFVKNRLQHVLDEGGQFGLDVIANASWDYQLYGVIAHNDAIKYINKYLRCVMSLTPSQLNKLKKLQDAHKPSVAPQARRARGGRSRQSE